MRVLACLLLAAVTLGCASAPPLPGPDAAEIVRLEVWMGMSKSEVKRLLGEPRWRTPRHLVGASVDVQRQDFFADYDPAECWLWGDEVKSPEATVCFNGVDHGRVASKSP